MFDVLQEDLSSDHVSLSLYIAHEQGVLIQTMKCFGDGCVYVTNDRSKNVDFMDVFMCVHVCLRIFNPHT